MPSSQTPPLILFRGVAKEYHVGSTVVIAITDVDLSIDSGEFVAFWGPSGSGKTTLLNLIAAIDSPTRGSVLIGGQDLAKLSDNKRSDLRNRTIGIVFQDFNLVPVLTAIENTMLPLEIQGISHSKARERAAEQLKAVGLESVHDHRPDQLSGGQKQRVAIARALVTAPALVVADEPTANLDTNTAIETIELMAELNRSSDVTFIFSTHDERLLDRVGRAIRLTDGRIREESKEDA